VEVTGQEAFPDWVVLVFPGGPNGGRPVAWPALVEPGYHTIIDRQTLGSPRLYILPRALLGELGIAARDNDNDPEGPVADFLHAKAVDCGLVDIEDKATLTTDNTGQRLVTYRLAEASAGRCTMEKVQYDYPHEPFKRQPSWARFAPRQKKPDAGPAASASTVAAAPPAPADTAVSSAAPVASIPAPPPREAPVPAPAKRCGCRVAGDPEQDWSSWGAAIAAAVALRRSSRRKPRSGA
jgi:hypothetical protein